MAGKLGLGHLETLIENLDRTLDLSSTVLSAPTITDAVAIDCAGGLVVDGTSTLTGVVTSPSVVHMGYVENTTAFIQNDVSNVTWTQPGGTILKNIYLFVTLQPTITVNAATDLGFIVGTGDGDGTYVAAQADTLIDGAANITALKTGAFLHVATRDIGDLGISGPTVRLLPVPDDSDDTTFVADGNYTAADRVINFGTSATNQAIAAAGTVRWLVEYIQVA